MHPLVSGVDPSKLSDTFFFSWSPNFGDGIHDLITFFAQGRRRFDREGDHFALWMIEVSGYFYKDICACPCHAVMGCISCLLLFLLDLNKPKKCCVYYTFNFVQAQLQFERGGAYFSFSQIAHWRDNF